MLEQKDRVSLGNTVIDRALHYYMGLTWKNESEASKTFKTALVAGDSLANSALRMAEHEVLHG